MRENGLGDHRAKDKSLRSTAGRQLAWVRLVQLSESCAWRSATIVLHELFADFATCHGRRVNAARYEMQSMDKMRALALPFCPCPSRHS
jgi:hypothetical protein